MKPCQKRSGVICRELAPSGWSRRLLRAAGCQGQKNDPREGAADLQGHLGEPGTKFWGSCSDPSCRQVWFPPSAALGFAGS